MSLDSFLNIIIPIGVIIFFGGILYMKLKEPIHAFIDWMKSLFQAGAEKINVPEPRPYIIYDY